jgi:TetR/AcrR family transcriptional repressor of nem operon
VAVAISKKTDSTKERIIATAMRLFHQQGYASTGMAEILEEAHANSGSLYHFFKTKEDLLLAVLDHYSQLLYPVVIDPAFATTDDAIGRIFSVLAGYREMLKATGCTRGCPIGNLALELADSRPLVREKISQNFAGWCAAIKKCLDEAGDRLPTDLDRDRLARFVLTVMEGGIMQARGHRDIKPYDESVAQLRDYFDRLLAEGEQAKRRNRP